MEAIFTANNLLFGLGIFIANIIQGLTGFAGALLAMPPSIHLQGLATAKVAVNTYGLVSSLIIFSTSYKNIDWKEARKKTYSTDDSWYDRWNLLIQYSTVRYTS